MKNNNLPDWHSSCYTTRDNYKKRLKNNSLRTLFFIQLGQ